MGRGARDERAALCYTSGTTGDPKGVVYSHRSVWLHSLLNTSGAQFGLSHRDSILLAVPLFHVMGWNLPYSSFMTGSGLILANRWNQPARLLDLITSRATATGTAWPAASPTPVTPWCWHILRTDIDAHRALSLGAGLGELGEQLRIPASSRDTCSWEIPTRWADLGLGQAVDEAQHQHPSVAVGESGEQWDQCCSVLDEVGTGVPDGERCVEPLRATRTALLSLLPGGFVEDETRTVWRPPRRRGRPWIAAVA